jgi:hypothetical protein
MGSHLTPNSARSAADNAARLIRVLSGRYKSQTLLPLLLLLLANPTACHTVQNTAQIITE